MSVAAAHNQGGQHPCKRSARFALIARIPTRRPEYSSKPCRQLEPAREPFTWRPVSATIPSPSRAAKAIVISRSSEYAIRALTFLAMEGDGRHHLARDMAERLGIPAPFLGKVLQPLVTSGLLHSQRGRSGGFKLAKAAKDVRLVDIVNTQETLHPADTCLLGQSECRDEGACPLHAYWTNTARAFHARLRETNLQELIEFRATHPGCAYPDQALDRVARARGAAQESSAVPA